jgi:small subunit ribosomal protein S6
MMRRYEVLFLTVPEITSDESSMLEKQFDKAVSDAKGTVLSYERWGKYRLAYPVRRYDYGIYYLMRFDVDDAGKAAVLEAIKTLFSVKYVDLIMRNMIAKLDPEGSLEYKRPESLEEAPSKEIDTFLKESKSLLGTPSATVEEKEQKDMQVEN